MANKLFRNEIKPATQNGVRLKDNITKAQIISTSISLEKSSKSSKRFVISFLSVIFLINSGLIFIHYYNYFYLNPISYLQLGMFISFGQLNYYYFFKYLIHKIKRSMDWFIKFSLCVFVFILR